MRLNQERAAIFYVPEADDPLSQAGASWLGYDALSGAPVPQPSPKLACVTQTPARYGFHATLKPPMQLRHGLAALAEDVAKLADRIAPFPLPPLQVGRMGDALALIEQTQSPALHALCDLCVETLDAHRQPADAGELARRRLAPLSPLEDALLERWGYPYVFAAWRFHMTLSSSLPAKVVAEREALAAAHFAPTLALPRAMRSLALMVEDAPNAPFRLAQRFMLHGQASF